MEGHYRLYKDEDIAILASTMCEADILEIKLSDGLSPLQALTSGMHARTHTHNKRQSSR